MTYNQERFNNYIDAKEGKLELTWQQRLDLIAFGETPHKPSVQAPNMG